MNEEALEQFRREWLIEVGKQKDPTPSSSVAASSSAAATSPTLETPTIHAPSSPKSPTKPRRLRSPSVRRSVDLPALSGPSAVTRPHVEQNLPAGARAAVVSSDSSTLPAQAIYKQAVEAESSGALDDALQLYRKAFRIDNNVDRIYEHSLKAKAPSTVASSGAATAGAGATLTALLQNFSISEKTASASKSAAPSTAIVSIISSFVNLHPRFEPEDEKTPTPLPIEKLPPELMVYILSFFARRCDYTSIEYFALVSRKARLLSLEGSLWREMANQLYAYPQIPEELSFPTLVEAEYGSDWRKAFVEQPRIRYDGVYIAVCHYVRQGHSENSEVNVTHLITYHRYLRFYPDGTALSLLSNDNNPSEMVHSLKPSLRQKGFFIGTWSLTGSTVTIADLIDPSGQLTRYGFEMILTLRAKPLGRWNKLELRTYNTVKLDTGEADPIPLKHERPFWFSKVRSWSASPLEIEVPVVTVGAEGEGGEKGSVGAKGEGRGRELVR